MTSVDPRKGLQAERTALAWTRTSFAVLGNGAVLMIKNLEGRVETLQLVAVGLAIGIALLMYLIGAQRQRTLCRRPLPRRIAPRREVYLVGTAVLVLILVAALGIRL